MTAPRQYPAGTRWAVKVVMPASYGAEAGVRWVQQDDGVNGSDTKTRGTWARSWARAVLYNWRAAEEGREPKNRRTLTLVRIPPRRTVEERVAEANRKGEICGLAYARGVLQAMQAPRMQVRTMADAVTTIEGRIAELEDRP